MGIIRSDVFVFLLVSLVAISNGYFASSLMQDGPSLVDKQNRSKASQFMVFMLVIGLTVGAMAGSLLAHILVPDH